jgi:hypothetical protein
MANAGRLTTKQVKAEAQSRAKNQKSALGKQQQQAIAQAQATGTPVPFGTQPKASFFKSTEAQPVSINTNTPQQQQILQLLSSLLPQGLQGLNIPGQGSSFDAIENRARTNFSKNAIPSLANRFAGIGNSGSALSSPDFLSALSGSQAELEEALAALRSQHGIQEQGLQSNNIFNLLTAGLRPQFDYGIAPGQNSGQRNIFESVKQPLINAAIGYATGGPAGAALGGLSGLGIGQQQQQQQGFISGLGGSGVTQGNSFGFTNNSQAPFSVQGLSGQPLGYNDILNSISAGYGGR